MRKKNIYNGLLNLFLFLSYSQICYTILCDPAVEMCRADGRLFIQLFTNSNEIVIIIKKERREEWHGVSARIFESLM